MVFKSKMLALIFFVLNFQFWCYIKFATILARMYQGVVYITEYDNIFLLIYHLIKPFEDINWWWEEIKWWYNTDKLLKKKKKKKGNKVLVLKKILPRKNGYQTHNLDVPRQMFYWLHHSNFDKLYLIKNVCPHDHYPPQMRGRVRHKLKAHTNSNSNCCPSWGTKLNTTYIIILQNCEYIANGLLNYNFFYFLLNYLFESSSVVNFFKAIPFSKAHWGGGVGGTQQAHFKFNITLRNSLCHPLLPHLIYLIPPTPALWITFRSPPPG